MRKFMKFLMILLILLLFIAGFFYTSPIPTAFIINQLFQGGMAITPDNYEDIKAKTVMITDIPYDSQYQNNTFDLITPKRKSPEAPTIIWVHGGAYVGGDKSDVTEYAIQIASHTFNVVNINYELAPSAFYPTPIKQLEEAYLTIKQNQKELGINTDTLYFAGDSAGAQIISQFVNVQVNKDYAERLNMQQTVAKESIKGVLLFCGPYDISGFKDMSDSSLLNFFFDRIGWAYIGSKDWKESQAVHDASIINHIDENFPATFITDGNTASFGDQGIALAEVLQANNVYVQKRFFKHIEEELIHEYQFMMDNKYSKETFSQMIEFLEFTKNQ